MKTIFNAICLAFIGLLILVQRDVDGELLVNGWNGLAAACLLCIVGSIVIMLLDTFQVRIRR
jgi:drug/metabolite transporter (DMT)-like permease